MDSTAAAQTPVFEPQSVGELGLLARQALLKRMDGAVAAQQFREDVLTEATSRGVHTPREVTRPDTARQSAQPDAPQPQTAAPGQPQSEPPTQLHERPFAVTDLFPHQRLLKDRRVATETPQQPAVPASASDTPPGRQQMILTGIQREVRAIREELNALSQQLGRPVLTRPRPAGAAPTELRSSDDRRDGVIREDATEYEQRSAAVKQRRLAREREVELIIRRNDIERINRRQQALLQALRRAEQRLADAPADLPPGLRDSIIGEIYRARFSIAMFGGTQGSAQLSGLALDSAG